MSAKSMYSYSDTLYAILDEFKPESAFEWGPGTSTQILAMHPAVKTVKSVEDEVFFYDAIEKLKYDNVTFCYKQDMHEYTNEIYNNEYDLIFVDGRNRPECLKAAFGRSNIVILHDAAREQYREAIHMYKHHTWTDDGNTVTLTNSEEIANRLTSCLSKLSCKEPELQKCYLVPEAKAKGIKI